jgi:DNA-binding CsgD family transcriptional regulator
MGRVYVSDEIAELPTLQLSGLQSPTCHSALTGRELGVFLRIAKGDSCTEIARAIIAKR